jgi:hypothetical protein
VCGVRDLLELRFGSISPLDLNDLIASGLYRLDPLLSSAHRDLCSSQSVGGWRTAACAIASSLHGLARADQRGLFSRAWCAHAARRQWLLLPPYGPSTSSRSRAPPLRHHPRSVCPCGVRCLVSTAFKAMRYICTLVRLGILHCDAHAPGYVGSLQGKSQTNLPVARQRLEMRDSLCCATLVAAHACSKHVLEPLEPS